MSRLSDRVTQIKPSATLAIGARATEMRASGKKIIGLSMGEPDFELPPAAKEAAIKAIQDGMNKYTPVDGLPALKQAIMNKFARENDLHYEPNQVMVSTGAKQCLYNAMQALLNPGDEVVIPAPYWVSYPDMAILAGATPVAVNSDISQQFKINPEQLRAAITPKTRMFIINSPSNPSGMAYSKAELAALAEVLLDHPNISILTDDIYEHVLWSNEPFANIVNACPDLYERTLVINGMSKAHAMTGWRLGYVAGDPDIIKAMKKIQSQSTSNTCVITQMASIAALESGLDYVKEMVRAFKRRHDLIVEGLNQLDGFECIPVDGTFYAFPNITEAMKIAGIDNDVDYAEHLLVNANVATVPGSAFGCPGYLRLSYATDDESLTQALDQIRQAL